MKITVAFLLIAAAALAQDEVRVIVGFNGKANAATFEHHGGKVKTTGAGFVAGDISGGKIGHLRREAGVAYVEEDHVATKSQDPAQTTPWGITRVKAPANWGISTGAGIRVAVIDTGIDLLHPDLVGQAVFGANFTTSPNADADGHGSHVSGTITAASNAIGVIGVAYGCTAVEDKCLDDTGSGYYSWIANGINWAASNNCRVINMSLGGSFGDSTLSAAVTNAWNAGVVLCAAAGNSGTSRATYPAYYTNCIAVAATDTTNRSNPLDPLAKDVRATFSNYGSWVDISGPGVAILSTTAGGYQSWSGTSMATPHASGVSALVWAKLLGDATLTQTNGEVRRRIELTKLNYVNTKKLTPGVVDASRALAGN